MQRLPGHQAGGRLPQAVTPADGSPHLLQGLRAREVRHLVPYVVQTATLCTLSAGMAIALCVLAPLRGVDAVSFTCVSGQPCLRLQCEADTQPLCVRRYVKKHKLEAATVTEKQCTKCLIVKPAQQFHAQRNVSTGLHSWCKTCVAAEYARNPRVCTPGPIL